MTCVKCGTMYPVSYDKCPKCKTKEAKQTQYKINKPVKNDILDEPVAHMYMVIGSEISQGDADYPY